jgi:hypothetical protein
MKVYQRCRPTGQRRMGTAERGTSLLCSQTDEVKTNGNKLIKTRMLKTERSLAPRPSRQCRNLTSEPQTQATDRGKWMKQTFGNEKNE